MLAQSIRNSKPSIIKVSRQIGKGLLQTVNELSQFCSSYSDFMKGPIWIVFVCLHHKILSKREIKFLNILNHHLRITKLSMASALHQQNTSLVMVNLPFSRPIKHIPLLAIGWVVMTPPSISSVVSLIKQITQLNFSIESEERLFILLVSKKWSGCQHPQYQSIPNWTLKVWTAIHQ